MHYIFFVAIVCFPQMSKLSKLTGFWCDINCLKPNIFTAVLVLIYAI